MAKKTHHYRKNNPKVIGMANTFKKAHFLFIAHCIIKKIQQVYAHADWKNNLKNVENNFFQLS
jgi:hypothetical protein